MSPDPSLVLLLSAWRHAFARGYAPAMLRALLRRLPYCCQYNAMCASVHALEQYALYLHRATATRRWIIPSTWTDIGEFRADVVSAKLVPTDHEFEEYVCTQE